MGVYSLEWRRLEADFKLCYKLVHDSVYTGQSTPFFEILTRPLTRRHTLQIKIPTTRETLNFIDFAAEWEKCGIVCHQIWSVHPHIADFVIFSVLTYLSVFLTCYAF